jgi:hypothetical protein
VSGSGTGAVVGAGLGGAGGATIGKVIAEPSRTNASNYDGNDHKRGKGHYKNKHHHHDDD